MCKRVDWRTGTQITSASIERECISVSLWGNTSSVGLASKGKSEPFIALLPQLFWFYLAELQTHSAFHTGCCPSAPASSSLTCFTKGPRLWVQEVPPRADGTKHLSAYVFRIYTERYFVFPLPAWNGLAFQSLGCLEKLTASVAGPSCSPVTRLCLAENVFFVVFSRVPGINCWLCAQKKTPVRASHKAACILRKCIQQG